jgi:hypothetical protein
MNYIVPAIRNWRRIIARGSRKKIKEPLSGLRRKEKKGGEIRTAI